MSKVAIFPCGVSHAVTGERIRERLRKAIFALDAAYMQVHLCIDNISDPPTRQRLLAQSDSIAALIDVARRLVRSI